MNKLLAPLVALTMAGCVNAYTQTAVGQGSGTGVGHARAGQGVGVGRAQSTGAIKGSGKIVTQTRNVKNFVGVMLDGSANIKVKIGPTFSVQVTTDDNLQKLFQTKLVGNQLVMGQTEETRPTKGVQVTITMPKLQRFDVDGAGKAEITGLNGGALSIGVDGAGNISANGKVDELVVNLDGAGNLDLLKLKAGFVAATMDGAGNIKVNALKMLRAQVNGVGSIRYVGTAKVQGKVEGIGSISRISG